MAGAQPTSLNLIELASNHYITAVGSTHAGVVLPGVSYQIVNVVSNIATTRATEAHGG